MGATWSHIQLSYVVPFYADGTSAVPLVDLLRLYASYPASILDVTLFVIVDDGSPARVDIPEDIDLNLKMLRVEKDIPWNQPGARNLGVTCSASDKVIMTDVDHTLNPCAFQTMIRRRNPGRTLYKLRRERTDGAPIKSHPNTFFFSRARFLRYYGYDEEFCGHYGFDDAMFWRWQRNHGTRFLYLPSSCKAVLRKTDDAVGFHSLVRDLDHNKQIAAAKRTLWKQYGPNAGHSRLFLNFPWKLQSERPRVRTACRPSRSPLWTTTWWLRWLLPSW